MTRSLGHAGAYGRGAAGVGAEGDRHKTTDIVLKHYFQPGREDFRQTLQSAMPKLLPNGQKTPKEDMRELIAIVRPVALRERLLKVWAKL